MTGPSPLVIPGHAKREPGIQGFPDVHAHLRYGPEPVTGRRKAPTR